MREGERKKEGERKREEGGGEKPGAKRGGGGVGNACKHFYYVPIRPRAVYL